MPAVAAVLAGAMIGAVGGSPPPGLVAGEEGVTPLGTDDGATGAAELAVSLGTGPLATMES